MALVLLGIGLEMIRDLFGWMRFKPAPKYEQSPPKPYVEVVERNLSRVSYTFDGYLYSFSVPILLFYSIAVGLVGGIYGIGGGAIIAPFLVSVFHLPIYTVAGATLAATFVNALAAARTASSAFALKAIWTWSFFRLMGAEDRDLTAVLIVGIMVFISGTLRFVQEVRSGNAAERLQAMVKTTIAVLRDGESRGCAFLLNRLHGGQLERYETISLSFKGLHLGTLQ